MPSKINLYRRTAAPRQLRNRLASANNPGGRHRWGTNPFGGEIALAKKQCRDVRYWHLADINAVLGNVRFWG